MSVDVSKPDTIEASEEPSTSGVDGFEHLAGLGAKIDQWEPDAREFVAIHLNARADTTGEGAQ